MESETNPPVCVGATKRFSVLLEPLDPSFYFCMCLCTRAMVCIMCVCICRRTREWNPRIHSLECEVCVFWAARGQGMSPKLTVTTLSGVTQSARVMSDSRWWVRAHAGCAQRACWSLPHVFTYANAHKNTHTHIHIYSTATCLFRPQHWSNVCVFNRCLLYLSQKKWKSISAPVNGPFILFCSGGVWTTFGRCLVVFYSDL